MTRPVIESGIPIPPAVGGRNGYWRPLLASMAIGDSFVAPRKRLNHIWRVAKRVSPKPRLLTRKISETHVRVWRIPTEGLQ